MSDIFGLYAIYDHPDPWARSPAEVVGAMLAAGRGARVVQLRAKAISTTERVALARDLGSVCRDAGVPLIVNDDLTGESMSIAGVAGVHLGQEDLHEADLVRLRKRLRTTDGLLGISTHNLDQVRAASSHGADYIGFGPVFATTSKRDTAPVVGVEALRECCRSTVLPVVAIGGITRENAIICRDAGAAAVATIGELRHRLLADVERAAIELGQRVQAQ